MCTHHNNLRPLFSSNLARAKSDENNGIITTWADNRVAIDQSKHTLGGSQSDINKKTGNGLGLVDSEIISIRQQSSFKL